MTDHVVVRPRRLRQVCVGLAVVVLLVFGGVSVALGAGSEPTFHLADQLGMFGMGVLVAIGLLLLGRVRVEADLAGIRIRNPLGDQALPWQVVRSVRLDDGAAWASLELHDDDTVALLAVQTNDGDAAVEAVLSLRDLLHRSRAG